ncbi:MAG: hypothetical protein K1X86_02470 [Ignavibacteria bacterium]|nr:hypothetical protein [Ignavibacteria bacterium]
MALKILGIIIALHGLIHLLGFVNQTGIKKVKDFSGITLMPVSKTLSKIIGWFWFFTALLFVISSVYLLEGNGFKLLIMIPAIVFSQLLIIFYWKDAKAGTIANLIIVSGIFIFPSLIS